MTDPELREIVVKRFPADKSFLSVQDGCLRYTYQISWTGRVILILTLIASVVILAVPQISKAFISIPIAYGFLTVFLEGSPNLKILGKTLVIGPSGVTLEQKSTKLFSVQWDEVHRILISGSKVQLQTHERQVIAQFPLPCVARQSNKQIRSAEDFSWIMQNFVPNAPPILLDRHLFLKVAPKWKKTVSALSWIGIFSFPATVFAFLIWSRYGDLDVNSINAGIVAVFSSLILCGICSAFQIDLKREDTKEFNVRPVVFSIGNSTLSQIRDSGRIPDLCGTFAYQSAVHRSGYGGLSKGFLKFLNYTIIGLAVFMSIVVFSQGRSFWDGLAAIVLLLSIFYLPVLFFSRERKSKSYRSYQDGLNDRLEFQNSQLLIHHSGETLMANAFTFTDPKKFRDSLKWPHESLTVETERGTHYYNAAYLVKLSDQELLEYLPEEFLD